MIYRSPVLGFLCIINAHRQIILYNIVKKYQLDVDFVDLAYRRLEAAIWSVEMSIWFNYRNIQRESRRLFAIFFVILRKILPCWLN